MKYWVVLILMIFGCGQEQEGVGDFKRPSTCCNCTCDTPSPQVKLLTLVEGQKLIIPCGQWLPRAVSNPKTNDEFGDTCFAEKGQKFIVLKMMGPLEAIVRYESATDGGGTQCEDGVLGVLDVKDFSSAQQESVALAKNKARIEKWLAELE